MIGKLAQALRDTAVRPMVLDGNGQCQLDRTFQLLGIGPHADGLDPSMYAINDSTYAGPTNIHEMMSRISLRQHPGQIRVLFLRPLQTEIYIMDIAALAT
jgi:hypothetical protein